jgi:hypothetical protein
MKSYVIAKETAKADKRTAFKIAFTNAKEVVE